MSERIHSSQLPGARLPAKSQSLRGGRRLRIICALLFCRVADKRPKTVLRVGANSACSLAAIVLPALLMTMSAFTRIIIVLAIARQAIGIPNIPSNQIVIGLSLIMTLFVMAPVLSKINETGVEPYLQGKLDEQQAFNSSSGILKTFMLKQTRKSDLKVFTNISKIKMDNDNQYSLLVLMPAFITSELKTAFEIVDQLFEFRFENIRFQYLSLLS